MDSAKVRNVFQAPPVTIKPTDLPAHRVNSPKREFEASGVYYTGAIEIKSSRFRGHTFYKANIASFA